MKRLTKFSLTLMLLIASVAATMAQSQGEIGYGLKIGAVYSNFSNNDYSGRFGWSAGAFVDYALSEKMGVGVELNYVEQGAQIYESESNYDSTLSRDHKLCYIQIPIMYRYNVWKGFHVKAGLQAGFLARQKQIDKQYEKKERPDIENSPYSTVDISIPVALNYAVSQRVSFEYRYNFGLRTINKDYNPEYKNRWMELSMALKF